MFHDAQDTTRLARTTKIMQLKWQEKVFQSFNFITFYITLTREGNDFGFSIHARLNQHLLFFHCFHVKKRTKIRGPALRSAISCTKIRRKCQTINVV
jgi:hypothetical protein